jgi:hypothetical protein
MPKHYPALSTLLISILFLGTAMSAGADDTVPHIRNGLEPSGGTDNLELEELWRIGGLDDDIVFGMITRIREDADGLLYVMDAQLSEVHVYSPEGEHLRTLFGEGEGPGEIRGPRDIVLMNDGRVGAVQEMPGKLIFVDRDGDPAGVLRIGGESAGEGAGEGGFGQAFSAFTNGDRLLIAGFMQKPGESPGTMNQNNYLAGFSPDGERLVDFASRTNTLSFDYFVFTENLDLAAYWWNAAVAPDGRVYVAPDLDRYRIEVFNADGSPERIIEREYNPWRRTQADREYFISMVKAIYSGIPFDISIEPLDVEPAIVYMNRGLRVHDDGTLWILTTHGIRKPDNGAMVTFDVFEDDGRYTKKVNVHGDWNGREDGIFLLDRDRAVVVTGYADAMISQFTGGNMSVDIDDEAGSVEVIYCSVKKR